MIPLLFFIVAVSLSWYLLIVRPQKTQQVKHESMVVGLQPGDQVLTVGGLYGRVVSVSNQGLNVELSPGVVTHIAVEAVARKVQSTVVAMQNEGQDTQQSYVAPPLPTFNSYSQQNTPPSVPIQAQAPSAIPAQTTFRAQVKPWGDLAPTNSYHPSEPAYQVPAIAQQQQRQAHQPLIQQSQMQPVQLPFQVPSSNVQTFSRPQIMATQNVAQPAYVEPTVQPVHTKKHSAAPQGMGSSLRLDDPSIADAMARARGELAELAEEYRRHYAPLVEIADTVAQESMVIPKPQIPHSNASDPALFQRRTPLTQANTEAAFA